MARSHPFEAVLISPRRQFGSLANALAIADIKDHSGLKTRYIDLPLLAVIVDSFGRPQWAPTAFLADLALQSRSQKGDTVRTYAEALLPWLAHLHGRALTIEQADEESLAIYRANLVHGDDNSRGRRYASATANQRIAVISSFHSWGNRKQVFLSPLGNYLTSVASEGKTTPWRSTGRKHASPLTPRVIHRMPRVLTEEEIQRICLLTPPPYNLMLRWCIATGMRRFEVCELTLTALPSPTNVSRSPDGLARITVIRKGSREQTVHVPTSLIEETNWYILTERARPAIGHENFVFLSKLGKQISRSSLTRKFRTSADAIGSDATLHHLRHTFAVHVLGLLERRANDGDVHNSLKTLQILLGHSNSVTTEIYLSAMTVSSPSVVEALDYLYGASI
jgi:site-specific recombinase XerD